MIKLAAAAALTLGLSGNALAAFEYGDLIRVVYNNDKTFEYATDLGNINTLIGTSNKVVGGGVNAITNSFASFGISGYSNLNVAYFTFTKPASPSTTYQMGIASTQSAVSNSSSKVMTYTSKAEKMIGTVSLPNGSYDTATIAGTDSAFTAKTSNTFLGQMFDGSYGGLVMGNQGGILNLAALATTGHVDQNFFTWTGTMATLNVAGAANTRAFTLTTMDDGSTVVNQTPVPAAAWLLFSGLAGLVGVRRRMNKEA